MSREHLIPLNQRTKEDARRIQVMGGKTRSHKRVIAATFHGLLSNKKLTLEQRHFMALLKDNQFATAIKDMMIMIATQANTSDDWYRLLTQLIKMPFIEKVYMDLYKEKQQDIIPIVVEVLSEHGQEQLIDVLYKRLQANGWDDVARTPNDGNTEVPEVRPNETPEQPQGGVVEGEVDKTIPDPDVLYVHNENSSSEKPEEGGDE